MLMNQICQWLDSRLILHTYGLKLREIVRRAILCIVPVYRPRLSAAGQFRTYWVVFVLLLIDFTDIFFTTVKFICVLHGMPVFSPLKLLAMVGIKLQSVHCYVQNWHFCWWFALGVRKSDMVFFYHVWFKSATIIRRMTDRPTDTDIHWHSCDLKAE